MLCLSLTKNLRLESGAVVLGFDGLFCRAGEFDNAGAMMSVDETLMCSFQILKPADKRKFQYGGLNAGRPVTPPRGATNKNKKK